MLQVAHTLSVLSSMSFHPTCAGSPAPPPTPPGLLHQPPCLQNGILQQRAGFGEHHLASGWVVLPSPAGRWSVLFCGHGGLFRTLANIHEVHSQPDTPFLTPTQLLCRLYAFLGCVIDSSRPELGREALRCYGCRSAVLLPVRTWFLPQGQQHPACGSH